jgi:hypothetical protein
MTSTSGATHAPVTVPELARLVGEARQAATAVTSALASDPTLLAEVPDELLEALTLDLHATVGSASAAASVVTGRLDREVGSVRGKLIAGRYPSTSRFLEQEAGLSATQAKVAVAQGRDLVTHSTRVADAWLAGQIPGGAVRDLTLAVSDVLRRSSRTDTPLARGEALDVLLPLARTGNLRGLRRAVAELSLRLDPDGGTEEALHAYENQTLSLIEAGSMVRITGWLTPEAGAATATVLQHRAARIAAEQAGPISHERGCDTTADPGAACSCGEADRARRAVGLRHDQLLARALGELMTDQLDDGRLGSHHRVAPHLTVITDLTDLADASASMIGRLTMPGSDDDLLVPEVSVRRLMCDADVTRVVTSRVAPTSSCGTDVTADLQTDLAVAARSVLYVGRAERTVPARLRRALETRDRRCAFPGCHAHVRRCHAHHVDPWENGGSTDLPNLALLCVAHHHAVHEGGWSMRLRAGVTGHEQGCWEFDPPPRRRRP